LALSPTNPDPRDADQRFLREEVAKVTEEQLGDKQFVARFDTIYRTSRDTASSLAWIAFGEIIVFFGVLLVGFAYLWKRRDLAWGGSVAAEQAPSPPVPALRAEKPALVAASGGS